MPHGHNKSLGAQGESSACAYLTEKGFTIIDRNFYAGRAGEIDIIAEKDKLLLFVEVKARNNRKFGGGIYSITSAKKKRLKASANYFLVKNSIYNSSKYSIRFDLIIVEGDTIESVEDIIR